MKVNLFFILFGTSILFVGCNKNKFGCSRRSITTKYSGYATIKSISEAPSDEYNCEKKPQKIVFDFEPENQSDRDSYHFDTWSDFDQSLTVHAGQNPSENWVNKSNLKVGTRLKCTRIETEKSCSTPVVFEFSELDKSCGCD